MSIKDIWGDREKAGYNNSYLRVIVIKDVITENDKKKFEDFILEDEKDKRLFGSVDAVMYAEVQNCGHFDELIFDIHKGDFLAAKRVSELFFDAVVFADVSWDYHHFEVYRNGIEYKDYLVSWEDNKEPKGYKEEDEEETYYDCDVEVRINLPFCEYADTIITGGGMCEEDEFKEYKDMIDSQKTKNKNEVR